MRYNKNANKYVDYVRRRRGDLYCVLPHLDRAETEQYIRTHISYSECAQELFTDKAVDEVQKYHSTFPLGVQCRNSFAIHASVTKK